MEGTPRIVLTLKPSILGIVIRIYLCDNIGIHFPDTISGICKTKKSGLRKYFVFNKNSLVRLTLVCEELHNNYWSIVAYSNRFIVLLPNPAF